MEKEWTELSSLEKVSFLDLIFIYYYKGNLSTEELDAFHEICSERPDDIFKVFVLAEAFNLGGPEIVLDNIQKGSLDSVLTSCNNMPEDLKTDFEVYSKGMFNKYNALISSMNTNNTFTIEEILESLENPDTVR